MGFTKDSTSSSPRDSVDDQRRGSTGSISSLRSLRNSIVDVVSMKANNEKWESRGRSSKSPAYGYGSAPGYVTMGY